MPVKSTPIVVSSEMRPRRCTKPMPSAVTTATIAAPM